MSRPRIPHLAWPVAFRDGRAVLIEQDSQADVEQCVEIILRTPRGSRIDLPEFGLADQAFRENGADLEEIREALETWEPRAEAEIAAEGRWLEELVDRVSVEVRRAEGA